MPCILTMEQNLKKTNIGVCALGFKDGFGSDTDEIESECHLLPHFNSDTNANANLIRYEYKTDSSNPDSDPDTFSI